MHSAVIIFSILKFDITPELKKNHVFNLGDSNDLLIDGDPQERVFKLVRPYIT